ncbi:MAG TPA: hypothetical protein VJZ71_08620 [Phycisphaerae bacterium]|nr:hypothetical protein [Phycisphaerae bacterium]
MTQNCRWVRRLRKSLGIAASGFLLSGPACMDSDIAKRFREGYAPGLVEGLSTFITDPANAEAGLQQTGAALFEGIGAILQPRTGSSAADSN